MGRYHLTKTIQSMSGGGIRKRDWENTGLRTNGEYLSCLRFRDGIVSHSETAEHLPKMLELQLEGRAVHGAKYKYK